MAGAFITVNVNDAAFERELAGLLNRSSNLRPLMKNIGVLVEKSVRQNFVDQGRPAKWKPLSGVTLFLAIGGRRGYKKRGGLRIAAERKLAGKKILIGQGMHGGLMASIHWRADGHSVAIGTDKPYGAIHQFGGMAGRNKKVAIPARPYLVLQDEDKTGILALAKQHLTRT